MRPLASAGLESLSGAPTSSILIVDDRPENLLALEAALAPLQQHVLRAESGEAALRALLKNEIAVIILDVQMPGLDGFETAGYIKQIERTRHIPIIFLTAIDKEAQHVFRGYTAGAVDYLFKPFDPTVLRSKVSVFIDLHQNKQELALSEERFRRTFDHAPIGVALVGLNGTLFKVNRAMEDLTGLTSAELVSRRIQDVINEADAPLRLEEMVNEVTGAGASWQAEHKIITRDGTQRHALVSVSFIAASSGTAPHYIFQITDITERRELEEFRERFVSHAAHELRTPASVIAGTASLLHDNAALGEKERQQSISALYRQSQRLTTMVCNLLDLARLREGRLPVDLASIDLRSFVPKVVDDNPPPEAASVQIAIDDDCVAMADLEAMDQILSNLLINAYRYGGDRIAVTSHTLGDRICLSVSDNGPGVSPELLPKLFEPFTRGKTSSAVGGSGLGLALVKSLVEATGGDIRYEPSPEGGAGFELRFPAAVR